MQRSKVPKTMLLKAMFNQAIKCEMPGVSANPATGIKLFNPNNAGGSREKQEHPTEVYSPSPATSGMQKRGTLGCQMG
jgi:hypothetical protein